MDVGALTVKLEADARGFKSEIDKAVQAVNAFETKSGQMQTAVRGHFASMGASVQQFGALIGVSLGTAAIVNFAKSAVNLGDKLSDLSETTGISIHALAGLRTAAEQSGSSIDVIANASRMMLRNLSEGAEGSKQQADALRRLGIDTQNLGRYLNDTEGFLEKVATGLGNVKTKAEQFALAQEIAGRGGAALVAVLLQIAEKGMPRVSEEAARGYEVLGKFKDSVVAATGATYDFFASLVSLGSPSVLQQLDAVNARIALLQDRMNAGPIMKFLGPGDKDIARQIAAASDEQQRLIEEIRKGQTPDVDNRRGGPDPSKIKAVIDGLQKQSIALQGEHMALTKGESAALAWTLAHNAMAEAGIGRLTPAMQVLIDKIVGQKDAIDDFEISAAAQMEIYKNWENKTDAATKSSESFLAVLGELKLVSLSPFEKELAEINRRFDAMVVVISNFKRDNPTANIKPFLEQTESARRGELMAVKAPVGLSTAALDALDNKLQSIDKQAEIFGDTFDVAGAKINAFQGFIIGLGNDIDLLDPKIQERISQMRNLVAASETADIATGLIEGAGRGITSVMQGIATGTLTVEQGFRNMGIAMVSSLVDAIIQLTIIKPLIDAVTLSITAQNAAAAAGGGGGGGGGGGWLGSLFGVIGGLFAGFFDEGGTVPGPIGKPRVAVVHGGEDIIPVGGGRGAVSVANNYSYSIDARGAQRGVSDDIRRAIAIAHRDAVNVALVRVADTSQRSRSYNKRFK